MVSQRHLKTCPSGFSGFFYAENWTLLSQFFPLVRHCRKAPRLPDPGLARSALDGKQKDWQTATPLKKAMAAKPRWTLKEINQGQYRSNCFSRECNNGHWCAPNALLQLVVGFPGVASTKVLF